MTFISVSPKTGLPKEYANSAEFYKEVEAATAKPSERQREVKTYADASKRLREETGLDLRSPAEKKAAADNEFIEQRIAEGVSKALERQQEAQQAGKAGKATNQSPPTFTLSHAPRQPKYNFRFKPECGCPGKEGHKPEAKEVIHSRRGVGPTMTAQRISWPEAQTRLKVTGIEI
jgi:pyruvate/2-oxoglutarate dehydrogenase complex dihydrolipoamide acyltransferase (E2) component